MLFAATKSNAGLASLFARLPARFGRAALLKNFPRAKALRIVDQFSGRDAPVKMARFFTSGDGFSEVAGIDYTDGVRVTFGNGEVAHFRPSGNADEFRCYAVADTQLRADRIATNGGGGPDGVFPAGWSGMSEHLHAAGQFDFAAPAGPVQLMR